MSLELFFIPILAEALKGPDMQQVLETAFATIDQLGHEDQYQEGYRNFQAFMAEVDARRNILREQGLRMAILMSTGGASAETEEWKTIMDSHLRRSPRLEAEYDALREAMRICVRAPVLQLLREGRQIGEVTFETVPGRRAIDGIRPGRYSLRTDTGLIIWEGELTSKDLIWTDAFGGRDLALAAEAGEIQHRPPSAIHVPEAGVILRIFPGLEGGSLEIELNR